LALIEIEYGKGFSAGLETGIAEGRNFFDGRKGLTDLPKFYQNSFGCRR
jgi:hypothetical protein